MQLIEAQGAFPIQNGDELNRLLDRLFSDRAFLETTGRHAGDYVTGQAGATDKILEMINF